MATPLTALLTKKQFHQTVNAQQDFETRKLEMTKLPILTFSKFSQPFIVESDASRVVISIVLL